MGKQVIPLDAAEIGMQLAEALHDAGGSVLLPAGATLSEATIAGLRRREVETLCVEVAAAPLDDEAKAALRLATEQRLRHLFRHAGDGPTSSAFFQAVLDYRLEQLP